jgi:hypothetical protein
MKYKLFSQIWCKKMREFCKIVSYNSIENTYTIKNKRGSILFNVLEDDLEF